MSNLLRKPRNPKIEGVKKAKVNNKSWKLIKIDREFFVDDKNVLINGYQRIRYQEDLIVECMHFIVAFN